MTVPKNTCPGCRNASKTAVGSRAGILIVGNLNVGKFTLFSRLCPAAVTEFSFPGTTVTIKSGPIKGIDKNALLTPGIYSLFSTNEDETVSRDILLHRQTAKSIQGILLVADAKNLKRSIAIALQYAEYGLPMLLDVNMVDEAASRGITIQYDKLAAILGVDVCTSIARESIGVQKIISRLSEMRLPAKIVHYPDWVEHFLRHTNGLLKPGRISRRALGLLLLAEDRVTIDYVTDKFGKTSLQQLSELAGTLRPGGSAAFRTLIVNIYNLRAEQIVKEVQTVQPPAKGSFLETFGDWCAQLHTGIPIAIGVMFLMYQFVGAFGATFLADTINATLFEGILIPAARQIVAPIPSAFIRDMIVNPDFGILPTGVFLALGLVLPVLFCFYLAFGLLEDSGYLARLSILLDKVFVRMGLNGKGVIPLVMGFSCVTMAILTTRLLGTTKERNIATFLLLLGMPCAPLIAVMLIVLERMPFTATLAVFGFIFLQVFIGGVVLNKILPGTRSPFIMEIPPMRAPKLLQVCKSSATKTYYFMKEAVPIFILASLIVFLFERFGGLQLLERIFTPLTTGLLGLPDKSVQVFIKTLIRRESGAAELEHIHTAYTNLQLVVNLLVMTFLTPCLNSIIVLFKERGIKTASVLIASVLVYTIVIGTILNHACRLLGITFT